MKLLPQYAKSSIIKILKEIIEANILRSLKEAQKARTQVLLNKLG